MELLRIQNASFCYEGGRTIFQNVSLSLKEGQVLTILGPNGAGKSTLLHCLMGFSPVTEGDVLLRGRPISDWSRRAAAKELGFLPQQISAAFSYTTLEYVVMGRAPYITALRRPSRGDYQLALKALEELGIIHLAQQKYSTLSGGERQQAAIARLLVQDPRAVILDEPTSALDFGNQVRVLRLVRELADCGFGVILTTHNPDHALILRGQACVLDREGRARSGATEELVTEAYLSSVYQTQVKIRYMDCVQRDTCLAVF